MNMFIISVTGNLNIKAAMKYKKGWYSKSGSKTYLMANLLSKIYWDTMFKTEIKSAFVKLSKLY